MKFASLALALFIAASAHAAEMDRAAAAIAGTEADFTQLFTPKGFKNVQSESGTVVFGPLPKMRWAYLKPEPKVFVFDGSRSWFYVPADKQVTVTDLDEAHKADLPFLMIGDATSRDRHFEVSESAKGGTIVTTLKPRSAAAMIRNIVVTTNATTHLIESVAYSDREGNRTTFEFGRFTRRPAPAELFHFTPPPGVQVVQQ